MTGQKETEGERIRRQLQEWENFFPSLDSSCLFQAATADRFLAAKVLSSHRCPIKVGQQGGGHRWAKDIDTDNSTLHYRF